MTRPHRSQRTIPSPSPGQPAQAFSTRAPGPEHTPRAPLPAQARQSAFPSRRTVRAASQDPNFCSCRAHHRPTRLGRPKKCSGRAARQTSVQTSPKRSSPETTHRKAIHSQS
ncbi:hypothetical protein C8Q77DRAFT_1114402 [Trametes polyzona]|nr:hypothetical protein C8Q77DRAFT_1114402 [Trametes polyzona]